MPDGMRSPSGAGLLHAATATRLTRVVAHRAAAVAEQLRRFGRDDGEDLLRDRAACDALGDATQRGLVVGQRGQVGAHLCVGDRHGDEVREHSKAVLGAGGQRRSRTQHGDRSPDAALGDDRRAHAAGQPERSRRGRVGARHALVAVDALGPCRAPDALHHAVAVLGQAHPDTHHVPDRVGAPHRDDHRRSIGLVSQQRSEVAAEKATSLTGDRVEHAPLRRFPGDQLRHAPQRGLLVGHASEILPRLRASRPSRHVDHDPR